MVTGGAGPKRLGYRYTTRTLQVHYLTGDGMVTGGAGPLGSGLGDWYTTNSRTAVMYSVLVLDAC